MLAELCPDLAGWPKRWRFDDGDLDFGSRLLDVLTPFMRHLLTTNLSRKTLVRHRDHLWMLGGELVRRGVRPDCVTDQTSAHDPVHGYLPIDASPADTDLTTWKLGQFAEAHYATA